MACSNDENSGENQAKEQPKTEDDTKDEEEEESPETDDEKNSENFSVNELPPHEFVKAMGAGWNLGNAMDTRNEDETAWGNPITTKAMIDEIAKMGFKTLRLPVTWQFHMGQAPNFIIEKAWLDKVEAIVNFALENNMFVIINVHHDESWIVPTYANAEQSKDQLGKVWTQIAERFKEYDHHVIFETLNEPRLKDTPEEWTGGTAEGREMVNQYHEVGVKAIRDTGGNNDSRKIMVSTYAASTDTKALNDYRIPNDDENIIVSVHSYFPYLFALNGSDPTWGNEEDRSALNAELDKVKKTFESQNRAVVMGEWGSTYSDNPEDRLVHAKFYAEACADRGISLFGGITEIKMNSRFSTAENSLGYILKSPKQ